MKILAFAASHRKESINRKLARAAADRAVEQGAAIDFAEYGDFDVPLYDDEMFDAQAFPPSAQQFIDRMASANGLILASPEYNWSFPGSLKNLIDWASVKKPNPFGKKAVLLLSASPSLRGGAQGLVHLTTPLSALGAFVYPKLFTLSKAENLWNEDGHLQDGKLDADLAQTVQDYVKFAKALA